MCSSRGGESARSSKEGGPRGSARCRELGLCAGSLTDCRGAASAAAAAEERGGVSGWTDAGFRTRKDSAGATLAFAKV